MYFVYDHGAGGGGEREGRVMRGFKNIVFITTNSHTYSQTIIYFQRRFYALDIGLYDNFSL